MIQADSDPRNLSTPLLARYFSWAKVCYAFLWVVVEVLAIRTALLSVLTMAMRGHGGRV